MTICPKCEKELELGEWPFCPHGKSENFAMVGDECDVWIENMGKEPLHFRSKTEHRQEMARRGLRFAERHRAHPEGGKSDTVMPGVDPYTMKCAEELLTRAFKQKAPEPERPVMIPDNHTLTAEEAKKYL